jgi:hypothetical protein
LPSAVVAAVAPVSFKNVRRVNDPFLFSTIVISNKCYLSRPVSPSASLRSKFSAGTIGDCLWAY